MENASTGGENIPTVKYSVSKEEFMIFTLAKAGWYDGNPSAIYAAPIDEFFKAYYFEIMARQFKSTAIELNKATQ